MLEWQTANILNIFLTTLILDSFEPIKNLLKNEKDTGLLFWKPGACHIEPLDNNHKKNQQNKVLSVSLIFFPLWLFIHFLFFVKDPPNHHYYSNFQMSFPHRSAFKDWLVVVCFDNRDPCFRNFDSTVSIYFRTS